MRILYETIKFRIYPLTSLTFGTLAHFWRIDFGSIEMIEKEIISLMSVKVCLFLYKNACNLHVLPCIYYKLSKVLYKCLNMITLAKYYEWYEVFLSLKVKVTYQITPPTSLCMGWQIWKRFKNAYVENDIEINTDELFLSHQFMNT